VHECLVQVHLGVEQLQRAVVKFEHVHAACPPPLGSTGRSAVAALRRGLDAINAHPN